MIFKDLSSAIKATQDEFNADVSPAQLLMKMFQDEARYRIDHFLHGTDLDQPENKPAKVYTQQRSSLVEKINAMGKRFNQRLKTLHVAIEVMDRFFLD